MSVLELASPIYERMPPISRMIWNDKYRLKHADGTPIDATPESTLRRVAEFLAGAEHPAADRSGWANKFDSVMQTFEFMPAGRIVAGAGAGRNVTLSNCYVMGTIPDSMDGIFEHLKEAALTMQAGGGIGYDFSPIRPKGAEVKGVGAFASGPLSFMDCWDAMCRTVMSAGSRRGAMMATMGCWHPDILDFITAKHDPARLRMFNVSVLCTDAFMQAVFDDKPWELYHAKPPVKGPKIETTDDKGNVVYVHKVVRAKDLWDQITRNTYDHAEPGVIFIDRINRLHNLWWIDDIRATNPCGEKAMGPYDSCLLGSLNLARFVSFAFTARAEVNFTRIDEVVKIAIRMMDNVIDLNFFPLPQQAAKARETRQLGLGITGLADMLVMLGLVYGSTEAAELAEKVMERITLAAYWASVELAMEKGSFPAFDKIRFLGGDNFAAERLPEDLKTAIEENGIRNSLLTSIAPTGTISLFMDNTSSGMEPIFAFAYDRKVLQDDGSKISERVEDYVLALYRQHWQDRQREDGLETLWQDSYLPDYFVTAQDLTPADHVRMQGALQRWVDSSISKTINCPEDISFEDFQSVYIHAWKAGCKGCTTYRPNEVTGSVLSVASGPEKPADGPKKTGVIAEFPLDGKPLNILTKTGGGLLTGIAVSGVVYDDDSAEIVVEDYALNECGIYSDPMDDPGPSERPDALPGVTYKIKLGGMDHAVYVNVTDIEEHGERRPFEVFINTKDPSHQAWTTALTRMISAVFRRPYDSRFVVDELKAVFDPTFSGWEGGRPVPSLAAAIGNVIERHMKSIGYGYVVPPETGVIVPAEEPTMAAPAVAKGKVCQVCFSTNLKMESGCFQCLDCGNSKCG